MFQRGLQAVKVCLSMMNDDLLNDILQSHHIPIWRSDCAFCQVIVLQALDQA
jgi:hypothetical protein